MKKQSIFKLLILLSIAFVSCTKEETIVQNVFDSIDSNIIVSSEGNFGAKDGSVSYFGKENSEVFYYESVNGAKVAGLIQSICFGDQYAYIVLNDVNQITVVDKYTFDLVDVIQTGLENPRYMTIAGDKGYITNWGSGFDTEDDYLAILNLNTNTIEDNTISLENGVERILSKDNKLYVSHQGAYGSNNIVSIIDLASSYDIKTITVKDNPDEMFFNNAGELVVLSQGKPIYDDSWNLLGQTTGAISFINTEDNTIHKELVFEDGTGASLMSYDDGVIYYYQDEKVYSITDDSSEISVSNGISVGSIYGMNTKGNQLFTVSYSFTSLSKLKVINVLNGETEFSSAVGLGASKVYFTE